MMSGYIGNPDATEAAFVDGWLKTGDTGYCEGEKWYVCYRAKEIIKVRGWQVSPTELENCLLTHPAILDAAVIGVEDDKASGELPRAYVVLRQQSGGPTISEADVQGYFHTRLAKYKALAGGVRIIDSIPKGSSGKVLRKLLKEMAVREICELKIGGE